MRELRDILIGLLYLSGFVLIVAALLGWAGFWWYGIAVSIHAWSSLSYFIIVPFMIVLLLLAPVTSLVFGVIGFIGTVWTLDWPWYLALALYLPTIAMLFISIISASSFAFFSFFINGLNSMFRGR